MTTSPSPSPLLQCPLAATRQLLGIALVVVGLSACGAAPGTKDASGGGGSGGVTFNGTAKALVLPSNGTAPTFSNVTANLFGFEALAEAVAAAPVALAGGKVQSASASCSGTGCTFFLRPVALAGVGRGLYAQLASPSQFAGKGWYPTYTQVANGNQVVVSQTNGSPLTAFAPAVLPTEATVANFANLTGLSQADFIARGAALALVSPKRSQGETFGSGVAGAYLSFKAAAEGALVVYPNATYLQTQAGGTNVDGAALVVGPPVTAAKPASYGYEMAVQAAGSGLSFLDAAVILRPGAFVITTLLPQL